MFIFNMAFSQDCDRLKLLESFDFKEYEYEKKISIDNANLLIKENEKLINDYSLVASQPMKWLLTSIYTIIAVQKTATNLYCYRWKNSLKERNIPIPGTKYSFPSFLCDMHSELHDLIEAKQFKRAKTATKEIKNHYEQIKKITKDINPLEIDDSFGEKIIKDFFKTNGHKKLVEAIDEAEEVFKIVDIIMETADDLDNVSIARSEFDSFQIQYNKWKEQVKLYQISIQKDDDFLSFLSQAKKEIKTICDDNCGNDITKFDWPTEEIDFSNSMNFDWSGTSGFDGNLPRVLMVNYLQNLKWNKDAIVKGAGFWKQLKKDDNLSTEQKVTMQNASEYFNKWGVSWTPFTLYKAKCMAYFAAKSPMIVVSEKNQEPILITGVRGGQKSLEYKVQALSDINAISSKTGVWMSSSDIKIFNHRFGIGHL